MQTNSSLFHLLRDLLDSVKKLSLLALICIDHCSSLSFEQCVSAPDIFGAGPLD